MRLPIKLIVRSAKVSKTGITPISLQYCSSGEKRVLLNTDVKMPIKCWNRKTSRISKDLPGEYGDIQMMETALTNQLRKAEDMVNYALKGKGIYPMKFLKEIFHLEGKWQMKQLSGEPDNLDVFRHIEG